MLLNRLKKYAYNVCNNIYTFSTFFSKILNSIQLGYSYRNILVKTLIFIQLIFKKLKFLLKLFENMPIRHIVTKNPSRKQEVAMQVLDSVRCFNMYFCPALFPAEKNSKAIIHILDKRNAPPFVTEIRDGVGAKLLENI